MNKLLNIKNSAKRDWLIFGIGVVVAFISWYIVAGGQIYSIEASVFRFFNDWPSVLGNIFKIVTYLGSIYALLVLCLVLSILKKHYLALQVFLGGFFGWLTASLVKFAEIRMRPYDLLNNVNVLEAKDAMAGFPSAHAALITAVATVLFVKDSRKLFWVLILAVILVCISRVVIGVHLPMDVIAGAGIGIIFGALSRLVFTNYNVKKRKKN